ncbi:acetyltransferase [Pseudomonas fluorescens]|uniref:GNAT family N-acetyltransferase n=1 Tax=Pseudomonas fluorescens TaxID=294 RepID=A0A1B3CSK2_PSEFL|nr:MULTISPECIES: GNAT family N-acetyltransferase [Pseudomonas fluorescens group]AOE68036.1 acetyltransferase [Pseudomonas fluorescens]AOE74148.1 acetyltransferase [Pseudomonas fluorescens]QOU02553.1 GNAT family N-acetyltransferase [Pseudomonas fluorescens]
MLEKSFSKKSKITFRRISSKTVWDVCQLSNTLSPEQRDMVADNGDSIAEAHFSENAWFRSIYADETLVGFVMLHIGADYDEDIDYPGAMLTRLMIAGPYQRLGFANAALQMLINDLKIRGFSELRVGYGQGEGSPEKFYEKLGFKPTGRILGEDEVEAFIKF